MQGDKAAHAVAELLPQRSGPRILHVSDIHNRPAGFRLIRALTSSVLPDVVVNTGDFSGVGGVIERVMLAVLARVPAPMVVAPGNHDSELTKDVLRGLGAVVLEGDGIVEVGGISFWGYPDPNRSPLFGQPYDPRLCVEASRSLPDIAEEAEVIAVHNHLMIGTERGTVVLSGHYHAPRIERTGGRLSVRCGSTGGGGPFGGPLHAAIVDLRAGASVRDRVSLIEADRGSVLVSTQP